MPYFLLFLSIPQSACSADSSLYTREPWALLRQLFFRQAKAAPNRVPPVLRVWNYSATAMASISHRTPLGRVLAATQLRAGLEMKYLA